MNYNSNDESTQNYQNFQNNDNYNYQQLIKVYQLNIENTKRLELEKEQFRKEKFQADKKLREERDQLIKERAKFNIDINTFQNEKLLFEKEK